LEIPELKKVKDIHSHRLFESDKGLDKHLYRVSYFSYKISKFLGLNSKDSARGGLLHDIGFTPGNWVYVGWNHPRLSAKIARKYGENEKVINIIESHQFPLPPNPPKCLESLIVWFFDKLDVCLDFFHLSNFIDRLVLSKLKK